MRYDCLCMSIERLFLFLFEGGEAKKFVDTFFGDLLKSSFFNLIWFVLSIILTKIFFTDKIVKNRTFT